MPSIGEFLGQFFSGVAGAQDGVHVRIWNELKPWVSNLVPAAARKWLPHIAAGVTCEVPIMQRGLKVGDCEGFGLAACDVCHRPVCLQHARIDQHGDAVCYLCVADAVATVPAVQRARARGEEVVTIRLVPGSGASGAHTHARQQQQQPPPNQSKPGPSPERVAAAFVTLGIKRGAKWDSVKRAHRKLSAENHPDRKTTPKQKATAQARFVEVQQAFEVLKTQYAGAS